MPRKCTVCTSPRKEKIDAEIAGDEPLAQIAKRHRVSRDAVGRHKKKHLTPALVAVALERMRDESARSAYDATVDRLETLIDRLEDLLSVAEERKSLVGGANIAREIRSALELVARLRGELQDKPQSVVVNVLSTGEFASITARLIEALAPWPEARIAAADVLDVEEVAS